MTAMELRRLRELVDALYHAGSVAVDGWRSSLPERNADNTRVRQEWLANLQAQERIDARFSELHRFIEGVSGR